MGRLAGFRYRDIVRRLKKLGFVFDRQAAGSHEIWFNVTTGRYTTIPNHPGDMPEGDHRVAVFDVRAAEHAAELAAARKQQGRPVYLRDTFIAGIALAHGATLATRNTRHFSDLPVPVINPWEFQ